MTSALARLTVVLWIAALTALPRLLPAAPPTEAEIARLTPWFMPAEFDSPKLSPTGEYLAFVLCDGRNYSIGIFDFATRQLSYAGGSGKMRPTDFWWKGPRRLLTSLVSEDGERFAHSAFDLDGRNPELLNQLTDSAGRIIDALPEEPDHVLRAHYGALSASAVGLAVLPAEVFRFNLHNGKSTTIAGHLGPIHRWYLDRDLNVRGGFRFIEDGARTFHWRATAGGAWQTRRLEPGEFGFRPIGFDADARYLWVWDFSQRPVTTLAKFDTQTGTLLPGLPAQKEAEATSVMVLGNSRQPVAAMYSHTVPVHIEPLNEAWRPAIERMQRQFAGYTPAIVDQLPDGRRWIVHATSSRFPGGYFLFDHQTGETALIATALNPALKESLFVAATPIAVPSRHGFTIRGKLWLPPGVKHPPLIVLCPSALPDVPAADVFNPYTQAYVAGGFAVAEFDGRGTMGYGRDFEILLQGSPAEVLREDLEDGVAGLAAQGLVDGRRAVLFGYGLGGALALSAAEKSAVFRAVVSMNAPVEVEQDHLLNFSEDFSMRVLADKLGWRKSIRMAEALSPLEVAPRLGIPSLHLMNEARWKPGKLSDDAKKLERALKQSSLARVGLAYSWFKGFTPPAVYGRDRASAVLRILDFYNGALAARPGSGAPSTP